MPGATAVFDCMVFLQAVANPNGPAFKCVQLVESQQVTLVICLAILIELHDVLNRPQLRMKFKHLTADRVEQFIERVVAFSTTLPDSKRHVSLPRDPADEPYLNLAIEAGARHLVT